MLAGLRRKLYNHLKCFRFLFCYNVVIFDQKRDQRQQGVFKVRLLPSKKICVICVIESPLKVMKNAFYFILKAIFVLKIFKFLT